MSSIAPEPGWSGNYVQPNSANPADNPAVDASTQLSKPGPNTIASGPTSPGNFIQLQSTLEGSGGANGGELFG